MTAPTTAQAVDVRKADTFLRSRYSLIEWIWCRLTYPFTVTPETELTKTTDVASQLSTHHVSGTIEAVLLQPTSGVKVMLSGASPRPCATQVLAAAAKQSTPTRAKLAITACAPLTAIELPVLLPSDKRLYGRQAPRNLGGPNASIHGSHQEKRRCVRRQLAPPSRLAP